MRVNRMRLLAPMVGAVLLLGVAVTPVAAHTEVSVTGCDLNFSGERHISPDFVYLSAGWGAKTKGQLLTSMKSLTWNVTVDGLPINVTPYITDPYVADGNWWARFVLPAGNLDSGESMTASVEYVFSRPVFDGYDHFAAGSLFTAYCTIYAD